MTDQVKGQAISLRNIDLVKNTHDRHYIIMSAYTYTYIFIYLVVIYIYVYKIVRRKKFKT